ncbi:histone-lysine N-methyltransferase SETMAR [Trichonephila clavipes]|nr:histone-lysine N-methyltransferase SETMAR [Trichonephila clavipes]
MLTEILKTSRMGAALEFLSRYHTDGEDFLNRMVTGDETWVAHVNVETKQQSMAWGHTGSPTRLRKARQTLSVSKLMVTVFWDVQGIFLIEFMTRGTTINSEVYCRTLKKLKRAIQNKRRGLLSSGVVVLHDNARPHTAVRTREVLHKFKWDVFQHPPYSPDLAPSDYHLFTAMKKWLGGMHFADDEELKNVMTHWFKSQAAAFYAEGIGKLVQRLALGSKSRDDVSPAVDPFSDLHATANTEMNADLQMEFLSRLGPVVRKRENLLPKGDFNNLMRMANTEQKSLLMPS